MISIVLIISLILERKASLNVSGLKQELNKYLVKEWTNIKKKKSYLLFVWGSTENGVKSLLMVKLFI